MSSWSWDGHDPKIRVTYQLYFCSEPLCLGDPIPCPGDGAVAYQIKILVAEYINNYPAFFCDAAPRLVPPPPSNLSGPTLQRHVDPAVVCLGRLKKELANAKDNAEAAALLAEQWLGSQYNPDNSGRTLSQALSQAEKNKTRNKTIPMNDETEDEGSPPFALPATMTSCLSPSKRLNTDGEEVVDTAVTKRFKSLSTRRVGRRSEEGVDGSHDGPLPPALTLADIQDPEPSPFIYTPAPSAILPPSLSGGWEPLEPPENADKLVYLLPRNGYQAYVNKLNVQFMVQWEMERLMVRLGEKGWPKVHLADYDGLKGSTQTVMPRLAKFLANLEGRADDLKENANGRQEPWSTNRTLNLWQEADREEESIQAGDGRGLLNTDHTWSYGGRITYSLTISPAKDGQSQIYFGSHYYKEDQAENPYRTPSPNKALLHTPAKTPSGRQGGLTPFHVELCAPIMRGNSCRLFRECGSRRILQIKLKDCRSDKQKNNLLNLFVGRILVLFERSYRALWAVPDRDTVFAIETTEQDCLLSMQLAQPPPGPRMPSFEEILRRYNDLERKPKQAMAKWAARPQILFSDTTPAVEISPGQSGEIADIICDAAMDKHHPRPKEILTDGCGLMSAGLADKIRLALAPSSPLPTAVQVRFAGAKGLLVIMSPEQELEYGGKDLILRGSMIKALPADPQADDRSMRIIDVVRLKSMRMGSSLTSEPLICLAHGGVSKEVLLGLLEEGLEELGNALDPRTQPGETDKMAQQRLIQSVFSLGGVGVDQQKRQCREEGGSLRVAGLSEVTSARLDEGDEQDSDMWGGSASEPFGLEPFSGQPHAVGERLYRALASGFDALTSGYANRNLRKLFEKLSEQVIQRFRIPLTQSLSAFIVPDSLGVLAPHEVHVALSNDFPLDPTGSKRLTHILGNVLLYRSPCKLPSDIQKFTAVHHPALAHLTDVIVLSANAARCAHSPASLLAGGDYDGDTATLIWDQRIVGSFTPVNGDAEPEGFIEDNFEREPLTVEEFLSRLPRAEAVDGDGTRMDKEALVANMQSFLLAAMNDDQSTSLYSRLHLNAAYKLGYNHPETIRLGRMFGHVLDARKSGLRIRPEVRLADAKKYGGMVEWWRFKKDGKEQPYNSRSAQQIEIRRPRELGSFIMDEIMSQGKTKQEAVLARFEPLFYHAINEADCVALTTMWTAAVRTSEIDPRILSQVNLVMRHVHVCWEIWKSMRIDRLSPALTVEQHYLKAMNDPSYRFEGARTPWTRHRSFDDKNAAAARQYKRRMADLVRVWHDYPPPKEIASLLHFGQVDSIRPVKVGAAVQLEKDKKHYPQITFDMDFATTCRLRVEGKAAGGADGAVTVLRSVWEMSKPTKRKLA